MITRYTHGSLTWFDVVSPTDEDVRELLEETAISPSLLADSTGMTPHSQVTKTASAVKATMSFPIVKRTDINHPHQIKFIATKKHLITIRYEEIASMHRFAQDFEVVTILKKSRTKASGGHLLITLLTRLYQSLDTKLDYIESRIRTIEEGIFAEQEKEMVFEISVVSRRLIDFRRTLQTHKRLLGDLREAMTTTFGASYAAELEPIQDLYENVTDRTTSLAVTLTDLRETNNALLTTKQNEIMKIFTILAFITFPLTLFTSMFGMNTISTPIVGYSGDFWLIIGIMALVSVTFFAYFRFKKWM